MASPTARSNARFSTYSGAPSIQPSLAPTLDTADSQSAHTSRRTSTYLTTQTLSEKSRRAYNSASPAATASTSTISSTDPEKTLDIKCWSGALERMQDARLDKQRYVMDDTKKDEVGKLALGAKVERALARRMVGQDATFSVKRKGRGLDCEKRSLEVQAN